MDYFNSKEAQCQIKNHKNKFSGFLMNLTASHVIIFEWFSQKGNPSFSIHPKWKEMGLPKEMAPELLLTHGYIKATDMHFKRSFKVKPFG